MLLVGIGMLLGACKDDLTPDPNPDPDPDPPDPESGPGVPLPQSGNSEGHSTEEHSDANTTPLFLQFVPGALS